MILVNEKDLDWAATKTPNLLVKNIISNYHISSGDVTCGISKWSYGEAGKVHTHEATNQDEVYIVLKGFGRLIACGEEHILNPGDMFHAKCGEEHAIVEGLSPDGIETFYILIPTEEKA